MFILSFKDFKVILLQLMGKYMFHNSIGTTNTWRIDLAKKYYKSDTSVSLNGHVGESLMGGLLLLTEGKFRE